MGGISERDVAERAGVDHDPTISISSRSRAARRKSGRRSSPRSATSPGAPWTCARFRRPPRRPAPGTPRRVRRPRPSRRRPGPLPGHRARGDVGRVSRDAVREGPPRAPAEAPPGRGGAAPHRGGPDAGGDGRPDGRLRRPAPAVQGRQGPLHGRAHGGVLPRSRARAGGGAAGGPLDALARGAPGGRALLPRAGGEREPLQLRLRPEAAPCRRGSSSSPARSRTRSRGASAATTSCGARSRTSTASAPCPRTSCASRWSGHDAGLLRRPPSHSRLALLSVHTCPLAALGE